MSKALSHPVFAPLAFLSLVLIWGTQFYIIKLGQLTMPPVLTAALRFCVAAAALRVWLRMRGQPVPMAGRRARFVVALSVAAGMGLLYWAQGRVDSAVVGSIHGLTPLFIVVLAQLLLNEPITPAVWAAIGLGCVGVGLLLGPGYGGTMPIMWWGIGAVLASAVCSALNKVVAKRIVHEVSPIVLMFEISWMAALLLLFGSFCSESWHIEGSFGAIAAFCYLGAVGSAVASVLYFWLLRSYPVSVMGYLKFATTLVAVLTGTLLGGEALQPVQWAGVACVLAGIGVLRRN